MIVFPGGDLDSISWLSAEVVFDVVNDNCLLQISANSAQIFNIERGTVVFNFVGIVTVKTIRDENTVFVEMIEDLVCIVLFTCCEDIELIVERKLSEEFFSGWTNVEHHFCGIRF